MPKQTVYSVHQRSMMTPSLERELGQFTDDAMADQAIDALYRYTWVALVDNTASLLWFDPAARDIIMKQGRERWIVDDKNSDSPTFFKRPHDLWNQVPPQMNDFKFVQESFVGGQIPVVEVKKKF